MYDHRQFYIDGAWVDPASPRQLSVHSPASGTQVGVISLGGLTDVNRAVAAARAAFPRQARTRLADRRALLERVIGGYRARQDEIAAAICAEMGAPLAFARRAQAGIGLAHLTTMLAVLDTFPFVEDRGGLRLLREPVGVCGLITPWNWPMNQVACKVAPALAAGCTMVLKPSEIAPHSAVLFAEVMHEAGVPPGVFNLVQGEGPEVGQAIAAHPEVDMVSITGSTRAGVEVARAAAPTVKRVHQELGGKSPLLVLDEAILDEAVDWAVADGFVNSGQSCNAPTRLLVRQPWLGRAAERARAAAEKIVVGDPRDPATTIGPVAGRTQFEKIQRLIQAGLDEGATLVCGGPGRPPGLDTGWYVRPTVFTNVTGGMTIAREEIFGPVLAILPVADEADAIRVANDTRYGLAAYIWSSDPEAARRVAGSLRAGMVHINGAGMPLNAPFGGYGRSGNGREWGEFGLAEFLELKAVPGYR